MCIKINKIGKQEVVIWWVQKRFLRYGVTFFVTFFSATIDGRDLIFGHKLHIGTPYCGKRFWTHQIPTSCLPTLLIFLHIEHKTGSRNLTGPKTLPTIWHTYMKLVTKYQIPVINSCWEKCDEKCAYTNVTALFRRLIWSQSSYRYPISWEAFLDPSDSFFLFADFVDFYTHLTYICICTFFVALWTVS
jgi:hypothetical protein